jgi:pre-mRNA-splicing factor SYF1
MNVLYVNYLEGNYIHLYILHKSFNFSYKLWYNYLKLRRKQIRSKCIIDSAYEEVNNTFERSLVFMHKVFYKIHSSFDFHFA